MPVTASTELSWGWIALMVVAPLPLAVGVALPLWRRHEMIFGNILGTAVIFGSAIALVMREYAAIDRVTRACLEQGGIECWPVPSAFTRYAVYASIGLAEVFILFLASLRAEARIRNRRYSPEWRRI
jgi:hypothetical protein